MSHPKVIRDGKVAVLYSPRFGAGWFSWNTEFTACLFDPEIVALVEAKDRIGAQRLAEQKWPAGYWEGACTLQIRWLCEGTSFKIDDYDGNESITLVDDLTVTA